MTIAAVACSWKVFMVAELGLPSPAKPMRARRPSGFPLTVIIPKVLFILTVFNPR